MAARLEDTRANREALSLLVYAGNVLPIFDGFDEMATRITPSELPGRLGKLLAVVDRGGKVLLSSRDHYFPTASQLDMAVEQAVRTALRAPRTARRLVIRPFNGAQIRSLVSKVAGNDAADRIVARFREFPDVADLMHRPLLLGMMLANLDRLPKDGPFNRLDLYEACVDRWISQSGGTEPEIFTPEQKQDLAEAIAAELWRTGQPSCPLASLRGIVSKRSPPRSLMTFRARQRSSRRQVECFCARYGRVGRPISIRA